MPQEAIDKCREEVDAQINALKSTVEKGLWTEERAQELATIAANMAVKQITDGFYMAVGRRTVAVIGALVVGIALWLHELWLPKVK